MNYEKLMVRNDSNNNIASEMVFNFSLKVAYDIILKSQQSDILFPELEIFLFIIYVILIVSGVVSNILVCFVVMRQCAKKKMDFQKSRNLYIVNLAVADLALCCICMPFTLIALIQREWSFGNLLCKLVPVVQGTNITVSAGTITAIALDRYNTIVKSHNSNNLQTKKFTSVIITIVLIWVLSFTVNSPLFFYTVIESVMFENFFLYEKCIERWPSKVLHSTFTIILALVQFVIPVIVLSVIHLRISSYLKFHIKPLRKAKPEIQIHSPIEPIIDERNYEIGNDGDYENKSKEDVLKKELLYIKRKESTGSENSQRSTESFQRLSDCSRKNSDSSRKNSDSSRNSCELSPRKKSDFFVSLRETSDFYGFSFSRFSEKSKSNKSHKRREICRNKRTTFILSCIAVIYAISWLPMTIFQITSSIIPQIDQNPKTVYVTFAFCHILAMSSAITNPLLYGWLNTNFRREFSTIFGCVSCLYTKIPKSKNEFKSPFKAKSKSVVKNFNKSKDNEKLTTIPKNDPVYMKNHSIGHQISFNYNNGKLNTKLNTTLLSKEKPSSRNQCIANV